MLLILQCEGSCDTSIVKNRSDENISYRLQQQYSLGN